MTGSVSEGLNSTFNDDVSGKTSDLFTKAVFILRDEQIEKSSNIIIVPSVFETFQ